MINFVFMTILFNPVTTRIDREGVSFSQQEDVSIGYAKWTIVSYLDTGFLTSEMGTLTSMMDNLHKNFEQWKRASGTETISYLELQMEELIKRLGVASAKLEDIQIYIGNSPSSQHRQKREFVTAATAILGLATKIGKSIYTIRQSNKATKKVEKFVTRFEETMGHISQTVEDLVTFSEENLSFNRKILNNIGRLDNKLKNLEKDLKLSGLKIDTYLGMQSQLFYLKNAVEDFIKMEDSLLNGLVSAVKGLATPPFLSPRAVQKVIHDYRQQDTLEKSYFDEENVLDMYNLVQSRLEKEDDKIAVLNTVKIPTVSTKARLFRIVTYPLWNEEIQKFVEVEITSPWIAINDRSQYLLLSDSDLNSCQHTSTMILCEGGEMVFQNRDIESCESSLFFQDQDVTERMCNYKTNDDTTPSLKYVEEGIYHFSLASEIRVPVECTEDGIQTSENIPMANSGWIELAARCKAVFGSTIIRNLLTDNVDMYNIVEDHHVHNVDRILKRKWEALQEDIDKKAEEQSLNNEDIISKILDEEGDQETKSELHDLVQELKTISENALELRQNHEKRKADLIKEIDQQKEKSDRSYSFLLIAVSIVGGLVFALMIVAVGFFYYYFRRSRVVRGK